MIHKASKHQKHNRKMRNRNASRAEQVNTVSCPRARTPALGLRSVPAGCPVACATAAVHRNALYLPSAACKQRWLIEQVLVTQRAFPLPWREATERRRFLPCACCCAVAQPRLCGGTPSWVSFGGVEGSNTLSTFLLLRPACVHRFREQRYALRTVA